jgi:hypothetical protein
MVPTRRLAGHDRPGVGSTFLGDRLAQLDLHPTVIVDPSRIELLDPAADGAFVLERMRAASKRLD